MLLELADLEGHGRLRHVQPFRRTGEALELRDRVKYLEPPVDHYALAVGEGEPDSGRAAVPAGTPCSQVTRDDAEADTEADTGADTDRSAFAAASR